VRQHAPSFHALLPRNCIQLAAKNSCHDEVLSSPKAEWDTGFPFRPQNVSNQYPSNPRKPPNIAGFQRGSAPLVGSGATPRRGLGRSPKKKGKAPRKLINIHGIAHGLCDLNFDI
jgi:hypothetical protein